MPTAAPDHRPPRLDPGLRPQRGRLRGAGRPAGGGGFRLVAEPEEADAVMVNTCGFVEAAKKDSVDTLLAAADLKVDGRTAGGGRRRLPGRALRHRAGRGAARGRRRARLRRLRRRRRPAAARSSPASDQPPTSRGTGAGCCRWPPPTGPAAAGRSHAGARATIAGRPGRRGRGPASGWPAAPPGAAQDRLRLRPALHASARSRRSAAPTSPGRRPRSWPRRAGWRPRASGRSSWSARTPPPTARTSATSGCWSSCWPSSRPSTAWSGSGCPTCSRPRCGPA